MHQPAPSRRCKGRIQLSHLAHITPGKRLLQSRCPSGIAPQLEAKLHQRLQRRSPAPGTMTVSLAACLLAALLGTGAGLQCEVCSALGQTCTGSLQTCPPRQDSCGIFLTEVTLGTIKSQGILKGCVLPSQCTAGPISVNFGMGLTTASIACCTGDACKTVNVTLPPPDTEPNGLRCPVCFTAPPPPCRKETINCIGSETQCLDVVETSYIGESLLEVAIKGCASESACDQFQVGSGTFLGSSVNLTAAKCTAASSGADVPLSTLPTLPALGGLLLWLLS